MTHKLIVSSANNPTEIIAREFIILFKVWGDLNSERLRLRRLSVHLAAFTDWHELLMMSSQLKFLIALPSRLESLEVRSTRKFRAPIYNLVDWIYSTCTRLESHPPDSSRQIVLSKWFGIDLVIPKWSWSESLSTWKFQTISNEIHSDSEFSIWKIQSLTDFPLECLITYES